MKTTVTDTSLIGALVRIKHCGGYEVGTIVDISKAEYGVELGRAYFDYVRWVRPNNFHVIEKKEWPITIPDWDTRLFGSTATMLTTVDWGITSQTEKPMPPAYMCRNGTFASSWLRLDAVVLSGAAPTFVWLPER